MRGWGGHYRVELYVEESDQRTQLKTTDIAKHIIYHPFDKTYPEGCEDIGKDGRVRLSLLIKWYFVVAGVADSGILNEMKNYPERLRSMLQWVQRRISPTEHVDVLEEAHDDRSNNTSPTIEGLASPVWKATCDRASHLCAVEELSRSIIERVTERVTEQKLEDRQDEYRLSEIDQQLRRLRKERGRIEKRRKLRIIQLTEAKAAASAWMSSRAKENDDV